MSWDKQRDPAGRADDVRQLSRVAKSHPDPKIREVAHNSLGKIREESTNPKVMAARKALIESIRRGDSPGNREQIGDDIQRWSR